MDHTSNIVKNRSDDRIIHLRKMQGTEDKAHGLIDDRLFKGGNNLHAVKVPGGNMWTCKMEAGILPVALRQTFTSYVKLINYITDYFKRRGVEVVNVEDIFKT